MNASTKLDKDEEKLLNLVIFHGQRVLKFIDLTHMTQMLN